MRLEQIALKTLGRQELGGTEAVLTCYLKDNTEGRPHARRPAVVICPGGRYEFCSTREAEPVAFRFLAMDCQAFVLNYSTAPAVFPMALMELAACVALIREKAGDWHVDGNRVVVCGFSAGGHLAASLGVFWERNFLSGLLGIGKEQFKPDGLILCYPVIASGEYAHQASMDHLMGGKQEGRFGSFTYIREFLSLENQPLSQVPPVFMWHTDTDQTVPVENTLLFAMALKKAGVSLELHIFPEGRHGLALADEETDKWAGDDGKGPYVIPCCQVWPRLAQEWLKGLLNR